MVDGIRVIMQIIQLTRLKSFFFFFLRFKVGYLGFNIF